MTALAEGADSQFSLVHTIPAISEEASGPSYSVVRLCESLVEEKNFVTLAALDWAPMEIKPTFLKQFSLGVGPRRLGSSPAMHHWLSEQVSLGTVDLLHNHSLWMMTNVYSGQVAKQYDVPLVVSPRGTLSQWAMRSGSAVKSLFWPLVQRPALVATSCFHATAESEYQDIRRMGFRQPVAVIPNGIDIPDLLPKANSGMRTLLFLGRIHSKKGLDILLPAWQTVLSRFPEWRLRIVGPDNGGYLAQMKKLAADLKLQRIEFSGPLYGEDKWKAYAQAELFVLPTYSENFGMSVAEALAAGTPAIVSKGAPWADLEKNRAGWWIDIGCEALVACLEDVLSCSTENLASMGLRGRNWMVKEYSWKHVSQRMVATYQWLLHGGCKPEWVIEE